MWVKELSLESFRTFSKLKVQLENGVNIVYGGNATGKTSFIEAIYFCAMGRSQRAGHDRELVRFGSSEAHLQSLVGTEMGPDSKIDVHLFRDGKRKGIAVNHVPIKKLSQLFGLLLVVIFTPEDLKMVKAGPGERRVFMDTEICQVSGVYYNALKQYYQALKQRNNLLKAIPKDPNLKNTLEIWDAALCKYGTRIMDHRTVFIEEIGEIAAHIHSDICGGTEKLALSYRPQVLGSYEEKMKRSAERDIAIGSTSVGIHKDDVLFSINGNDIRTYGSQGQQRTAALSVKLAEIELIKNRKKHTPVLLLDDVLSELDENRQNFLLKHIKDIQTVITCTGIEDVLKKTTGLTLKMESDSSNGISILPFERSNK